MQPSAPAEWRYLAELILRLEQKGYARMQPLTPEDVIAAPRIVTLREILENLVRAAREIPGLTREPGTFKPKKEGCWQVYRDPGTKWFSDIERFGTAYPELHYWYRDEWLPDRRDAPAFCAGITFHPVSDATRYALLDEEWQATLPEGVAVGRGHHVMRVVRTKYLSELIVAGGSFEAQAEALKVWATKAIADIMDPDQVQAPTRRLDSPDDGVLD